MYYDQGGMSGYGSQQPAYQSPQFGPSAGDPIAAMPTTTMRKRRPSYADYYNGKTGGMTGNGTEPTTWAEAQKKWQDEQSRLYPRGLIGGRVGALPLPSLGQMPAYSQPGQFRPGLTGGMGYGQQYVQRPGNTGVVHPSYLGSAPYSQGYGSQMPFSPGYLR